MNNLFKRRHILPFVFLLLLPLWSTAQQSSPYANIVSIQHACLGGGGSIEVELIGGPYDYNWSNGATGLILTNLDPGIYILTVIDIYGCFEEYFIEILDIKGCRAESSLIYSLDNCVAIITIEVFDETTGASLAENELNIQWSDGSTAGLVRVISLPDNGTYCVQIYSGKCCFITECFTIDQSIKCRDKVPDTKKKTVIVNEFDKGFDGQDQFVEILVIGNGNCGETFDLRGYAVDDNNGFLIPANDFINQINMEMAGINAGFLTFADNVTWANVPNGSLIVIHNSKDINSVKFPENDETDADQDGVYVLSADNQTYFNARKGIWNELDRLQEYQGNNIYPSWELISLNTPADGMQVRIPDGEFSHGISAGNSAFNGYNGFSLWLSAENDKNNCQFVQTNYLNGEHFICYTLQDSTYSPGLPNSTENELFIDSLLNCYTQHLASNETDSNFLNETPLSKDRTLSELSAYPNPFANILNVQFLSPEEGKAKLEIFTLTGQRSKYLDIDCKKGENKLSLSDVQHFPNGVLLIQLTLPSGEKKRVKIVHNY